jgi:4-amino-4-deoxy-L-arabinose transferase-like glycosyltransferase
MKQMMNNKSENNPLYFLAFLVFIYFICFYQLDTLCMFDWDESRVAISSYEMSQTGELIVVKYDQSPDLWSTKPPLLNWLQAGCIKIFGLNELAVRLPTGLAGAALLLSLFFFIKKHFQNIFLAYLVPLILGTSAGFYWRDHAFRTADYDGALTLFLFLGCILLFSYLNFSPHKKNLLYLSALFFSFAVLTKGVAGFLLFPGLLIYIVISKKTISLLKDPHFYFSLLIFISISFGFYFLREMRLPGYIKAVNEMEFLGRYNNTFLFHNIASEDTWLNFKTLVNSRFNLYYLLIPFSIAITPFIKNESLKQIVLFSNIVSFSLLGVLVCSKSKNPWYDLPALPFLSINAGISVMMLCDLIGGVLNFDMYYKQNITRTVVFTFICCVGFIPAVVNVYAPLSHMGSELESIYMVQDYIRQDHVKKNSFFLSNGISQSQVFYLDMANSKGYNVKRANINDIIPGNVYFASQKDIQQYLESHFKYDVLEYFRDLKVYRVRS